MEQFSVIFLCLLILFIVLYVNEYSSNRSLKDEIFRLTYQNIELKKNKESSVIHNKEEKVNSTIKNNNSFDFSKTEYYDSKKIKREYLYPIKNLDDTGNYFYGKKVVISGDFESFTERNEMAKLLWEAGADIDTNVGKYTDVLIVGDNAGDVKVEYSEENNIEIMYEENFLEEFNLDLE